MVGENREEGDKKGGLGVGKRTGGGRRKVEVCVGHLTKERQRKAEGQKWKKETVVKGNRVKYDFTPQSECKGHKPTFPTKLSQRSPADTVTVPELPFKKEPKRSLIEHHL